ncbi:hypothetical protein EDD36DRAFT_422007 [Exophiala viscosa]|uniref:Heterokaryon incompatibility domain-containing protein n=2 Tax=Exophiala viscosa TaxID=2486360 RepID=A0AAN6DR43_9EURO|nr:hypothetical protein EDD36DRAFT_422007 [Exophiala viscosa]
MDIIGTVAQAHRDEIVCAWEAFLSRPWFKRTWIVQEVVLATCLEIHCGSEMILWEELPDSKEKMVTATSGTFPEQFTQLDARRRSYQNCERNVSPRVDDLHIAKQIRDIVIEFHMFKCSDPRDHVYALLSLVADIPGTVKLKPDYALTPGQTLVSVFRQTLPGLKLRSARPTKVSYMLDLPTRAMALGGLLRLGGRLREGVADLLEHGVRAGDDEELWRGTAQEIRDLTRLP